MYEVFTQYKTEIIYTVVTIFALLIVQFLLKKAAHRVGKRSEIDFTRTRLMFKYINILILFIAVFLLAIAWGMGLTELSLIFSSVLQYLALHYLPFGLFLVISLQE